MDKMKEPPSGHTCLTSIHDYELNIPPMAPKPSNKELLFTWDAQPGSGKGYELSLSQGYLHSTQTPGSSCRVCSNCSLKVNHLEWRSSRSRGLWVCLASRSELGCFISFLSPRSLLRRRGFYSQPCEPDLKQHDCYWYILEWLQMQQSRRSERRSGREVWEGPVKAWLPRHETPLFHLETYLCPKVL